MPILLLAVLIDYSVSFSPPVDKSVAGIERKFAVVINAGDGTGSHPYKLLLRAFAPDGSLACETTTLVQPWPGKSTTRRVAWFESTYSDKPGDRKVRPGKYLLRAYLTEQLLAGQSVEDTNLANNQVPFEPPHYVPVEFEVRPGAAEIRCVGR